MKLSKLLSLAKKEHQQKDAWMYSSLEIALKHEHNLKLLVDILETELNGNCGCSCFAGLEWGNGSGTCQASNYRARLLILADYMKKNKIP